MQEKKTVRAWLNKKIGNYEAEDFNELEVTLIRVQSLITVNELLGDTAMEDLIEFLKDYFPGLGAQEIYNACQLHTAGFLYFDKRQVKVQHYGLLSAEFLTNVLRPYENYRGAIIRKYQEAEVALIKASEPEKVVSNEEKHEIMVQFSISSFENFKTNIATIGLDRVYDFLKREEIINFTEERKVQFLDAAKQQIEMEAKRGNSTAKTIMQALKTNEGSNSSLESRAKALAVKAFFTDLVETETNLSDLFKKDE